MERLNAWQKIRDALPGSFYKIVAADKLRKEIRLSDPMLRAEGSFTPFTEIERHNRELERLDIQLEAEREINAIKEKEFSERWKLAHERHQNLEKILDTFHHYYQDNRKKVQHDKLLVEEYLEDAKEKSKEAERLRKNIRLLETVKTMVEKRRDLCEVHKDYLNTVVSSGKDNKGVAYKSIQDLISRFEDLKRIRDEKTEELLKNFDATVVTYNEHDLEGTSSLIESASYLNHGLKLEEYSNKLSSHVGKLNERIIDTKTLDATKILDLERSKMAINCLYENLCNATRHPAKIPDTDLKGQLGYIKKFIEEMEKIKITVEEHLKVESNVSLPTGNDIQRTSTRSSQ